MRKLALLLLLSSTTIHANPYMEAVKLHSEVYKYINRVAPTLYILNACQSELYVPTFNYSLEQTYKLAMANDDIRLSLLWKRYGQRMITILILVWKIL